MVLSKEIPARTYDKGIYLHEAGQDSFQYEETNRIVPIVSKYYERIHTDEFWDNVATNFGISIISPTPAPIVVIEPDPLRPELSRYVLNETQRSWMYEVEAVVSNATLLSSLNPDQRKAYDIALIQRDNEFGKLRRLKYLDLRIDTASRVNLCNEALEDYFLRSPGSLSDAELSGLLHAFVNALQVEADQEAQCAVDFMADADLKAPSNIEFSDGLLDTNQRAREMVVKAQEDCQRVGVATLGPDYNDLLASFDKILFALRAVNFIITEKVRPDRKESYAQVIRRVGLSIDPGKRQLLTENDAARQVSHAANHLTLSTQALDAYWAHNYDRCHEIGRELLSHFDLEGYNQGIGMVLIAMHPGEFRRRWCARQGLHVLKVLAKSNPTPFLEQWVKIATQVHNSIEDLAVNSGVGDDLCVLGID